VAAAAVLVPAARFVTAHAAAFAVASAVLATLAAGAGGLALRARRRRAVRQAGRDRDVAVTDGMTGAQFEQYIARLMRRDGLRQVRVCGGSGDLGADITAYTDDGRRIVAQCKRYTGSLGDPHIQRFNGTAWQIHGADVAVLVTTGRPTANARRLAQRCGIVIVDRDTLAAWATGGRLPAALTAGPGP
jgi:restriction system protein